LLISFTHLFLFS